MKPSASAAWLASNLRGPLITPEDSAFHDIQWSWNRSQSRRPAFIAQCAGQADIITCVNFARANDIPLRVRNGDHRLDQPGEFDRGLLLDLSSMNGVIVDPGLKTAQIQAGATSKDIDHETQAFGLATPLALYPGTGVSGLSPAGGTGILSRRFGLTFDNLLTADVVSSEGELIHASETDDAELLWALKGGDCQLGVVTSLEFKLHQVGPNVVVAQSYHPIESLPDALQAFRDFVIDAPDDVGCFAFITRTPPLEYIAPEHVGKPIMGIIACCSDELEAGMKRLKPLTSEQSAISSSVKPVPYLALQSMLVNHFPDGARYRGESIFLDGLSNQAIEAIEVYSSRLPGEYSSITIEALGGQIARTDSASAAFADRGAVFKLSTTAGWLDPSIDAYANRWGRDLRTVLDALAIPSVNEFLAGTSAGSSLRTARQATQDRLTRIQTRLDPTSLFTTNRRIAPAEVAPGSSAWTS